MPSVLIAGATGYLGRFLCAEYHARGYRVTALVRDRRHAKDLVADALIEAQATQPETLTGLLTGIDLVVSALGITRQADGLSYRVVDFGANLNLLREAERAGVGRFAYVHVIRAQAMRHVPLVSAKADFVHALQASGIASTVIAPSGYFSDMGEFFSMARAGRVWLFGSGANRINPIHGADLAAAVADATEAGRGWLDVGGPETFTHTEIARMAFAALDRPPRITRLPDTLRKAALALLPWITPRRINGPAQFFLTAMSLDMVGAPFGTRRLAGYFAALAERPPSSSPALPEGDPT
ncbi:SDR family oxidoreductase [Ruegeria pomeroyi]|uniref:SDR family oxidoreductase n=1 Tax=Ruegeria pomeroyi TaxID=89184 RepID=A0A9Q3ZMT5_9RHOB|nr:SDR family oxidoreductase [Ruegeria pomeroyi]MCE8536939.1 SDR family oxidoreductase [Ruegeria pomeroyi]